MTTKRHREAVSAIKAWLKKTRTNIKLSGIRHIHPRAYVVGYAASQCLIVSTCWTDSEPHLRQSTKEFPLKIIHEFDESLKPGDWCITGYCSFKHMGSWPVAVPIPKDSK
jgi:hypothetical protein